MKAWMFGALCALVVAGCSPALQTETTEGSELPHSLLDPYLRIADARTKFANLSVALDTYMKGFKMTLPDGVRSAYCPMKQKPWIQEGDVIRNPYYGTEMSTCGEFR